MELGDYDLFTYRIRLHEMDEAVLLHEYLHHLQNITTVFGVERLNAFVQIAAHIAKIARRGKPFAIPLMACQEQFINSEDLLHDYFNVIGHWQAFTYIHQREPLQTPRGFLLKKDRAWAVVDIDWYDDESRERIFALVHSLENTGKRILYPMGGFAAAEGQAFCLSRILKKQREELYPMWPYRFLWDYLQHIHLENPEWTMLVLGELALNSIPGRGMFKGISQIENGLFAPATDGLSALKLLRDMAEHNRQDWETAFQAERELLDELQEKCQEQYEPFREAMEYSIDRLRKGLDMREQDPACFLARLMEIEGTREELFQSFPPPFLEVMIENDPKTESNILKAYTCTHLKGQDGKEHVTFMSSDPTAAHASNMFQKLWYIIEGLFINPEMFVQESRLIFRRERQDGAIILYPQEVVPDQTNYEGILLRVLNLEGIPLLIHPASKIDKPKILNIRLWKCCSFCNSLKEKTEFMVENQECFICNHCLDKGMQSLLFPESRPKLEENWTAEDCSFCKGIHKQGKIILSAPSGILICNECILWGLETITRETAGKTLSFSEALEWLKSKDGKKQYMALVLLSDQKEWRNEEALKEMIPTLGSDCPYQIVRQKALETLFGWDKSAIPILLLYLSSPDWKIRANCVLALGHLGKKQQEILEAIFPLHKDLEAQVRLRLVWALVTIEVESVWELLERMIAVEKEDFVIEEIQQAKAMILFREKGIAWKKK